MAPRKLVHRLALTEKKASGHTDKREFLLDFYGTNLNVTVAHKAEPIRRWIGDVQHHSRRFLQSRRLIVGISFGGENDSLGTMHLSVARNCLIIQLNRHCKASVEEILTDFFSDNGIKFVGIDSGNHTIILRKLGIYCHRIHDMKEWLFKENQKPCYKEIFDKAAMNFKFDLNPQISNSNWRKKILSHRQIYQGALVAFVSLKIGVKILGKHIDNLVSGMAVHDDCKLRFLELKAKRIFRSIVYKIDQEKQVIVEKLGESEQSYDDFAASLPDNECRYAIYDFNFVTEKNCHKNMVFFIAWSPDAAKGRDEINYASFKDRFKREFDGIQVELQATDPTEIGLDVFESHTN